MSFHYDDPGAEAPQTLLLAVPPMPVSQWSLPMLLDVLNDTLDLAKIRAVHGEGLDGSRPVAACDLPCNQHSARTRVNHRLLRSSAPSPPR